MDTIKSSAEISSLFSHGKRIHTAYLTLLVLKQRDCLHEGGRVAFVAGKKNGNAVWRNSAKRRMRSICRELGGPWEGYDIVFLAKRSLLTNRYCDVFSACGEALRREGLR